MIYGTSARVFEYNYTDTGIHRWEPYNRNIGTRRIAIKLIIKF